MGICIHGSGMLKYDDDVVNKTLKFLKKFKIVHGIQKITMTD
jgi:hypothetical protein